jgi:integrase
MALRLTDRAVKGLPVPATDKRVYYDDVVKGFGCRVSAGGTRSFVVNYRRKSDSLERRYTIGSFPDWSTQAAREEAKRLKRQIDGGGDPVGADRETHAAATINDLCDRFEQDYLPRKRPSTRASYKQQIASDIRPALGRMKVAAVGFTEVDAWRHKISARAPTHANRALALLSRMFSLSVRWGLRPDNPCKGVERNREIKRHRYLTGPEMLRLGVALSELRDQGAANAIWLLLLTGARTGELLKARWVDFDLDSRTWTKPGSTTKQQSTHRVPLSQAAGQLLVEMREQVGEDAEWVFPAPRKAGPRTDVREAWDILRAAVGIQDANVHDLRHSYASVLASEGASLPIIGALLGHASPATTHRYAHLFDDPLRRFTETASAVITGKPGADVVKQK